MFESSVVIDRAAAAPARRCVRCASWGPFAALLVCYLAAHFALRLAGSTSLEFDESEQLLLVQSLAPGYNTQPPLPTWCFWGLLRLGCEPLAALTAVRLLFLGLVYFFLYATARLVLSDGRRALPAAGSLLLIPALGWDAVADRPHTTLLCAVCLATLYVALQVLHDGRRRWFVALGVCLGLGMLSKYNYVLFALALLLTTLTMPGYRRRLASWRLGWSFGIALVLCLPHLIWLVEHYEDLLALIRAKGLVGESGPTVARLRGLGMIAGNIGQVLGAMLAILVLCFPQICRRKAWTGGEPRRWLDRLLLVSLAILAGIVLVEGVAHIRLYWMLPFLTIVPLTFFLRIEQVPLRQGQWLTLGMVVFASVLAVGGLRVLHARHHAARDAIYQALRDRLLDDGFTGGIVWTVTHQEAGNLRLRFPDARVLCVEYPLLEAPAATGRPPRLLLWDASFGDGIAPLLRLWGRDRGIRLPRDPALVRYVESPLPPTTADTRRLGYVVLGE